jgi:predicted transcriptional regulator of viral defense system
VCSICSISQAPHPSLDLLRTRFEGRPFRVSEAVSAGVSRSTMHRLREAGELATVGRGVVQLPDGGMGMQSGLAVVSARAPRGTICLNSALAFWDLTDEIPEQVHLAVPRGTHRPAIDQPVTRVHVFDARTFAVERHQARTDAAEPFWIYSPERSVVDAFRMSRWVGRDTALHALRRYMAQPRSDPARLAELTHGLGGNAQLRPALEALLS